MSERSDEDDKSAEPDDDDTNADSYMDGEMGEEDEPERSGTREPPVDPNARWNRRLWVWRRKLRLKGTKLHSGQWTVECQEREEGTEEGSLSII